MLPENIDRFVDRLCALYPNRQVARNTIKSGWRVDKELLAASVHMCRRVIDTVERDGEFPSLHRIKTLLRDMRPNDQITTCTVCNGSGWGERYTALSDTGIEYTYVRPCICREGITHETPLELQHL
jgi:hypothetical protein